MKTFLTFFPLTLFLAILFFVKSAPKTQKYPKVHLEYILEKLIDAGLNTEYKIDMIKLEIENINKMEKDNNANLIKIISKVLMFFSGFLLHFYFHIFLIKVTLMELL